MSQAPWWLRCSETKFEKEMEAARDQGDWSESGKNADQLVQDVFVDQLRGSNDFGREGYHHLLMLASKIHANPELLLVNQSRLNKQLKQMPPAILDYFDPMLAPDWVDEKKLALASSIWVNNTITLLLVLYASSLPSCYVIKKGIPVLYTSEKLRDRKNISQRLFETGFMLDDVMSPGGIRVIEDVVEDGQAERYLWGKGYLSAKKVRALHASMRLMLQYPPHQLRPEDAKKDMSEWPDDWSKKGLGKPINQEDLAFTLLTFGYLLPRGLETWGCKLTLDQRNAVLHMWKVTGYIMGLRPDLMTDRWDEAEVLYQKLLTRGGGGTPQGIALTETVMGFVGDYLPKIGGLNERLPASMIIDQCGLKVARMILTPEKIAESQRAWPRFRYGIAKSMVKGYFFLRNLIIPRIPMIGAFLSNLLHGSGKELIGSFRDAFVRQPFFIPKNATTWEKEGEVPDTFPEQLKQWRQVLFRSILFSVGFLFIALFSFTGLLVCLPVLLTDPRSAGARLGTFIFSISTLVSLAVAIFLMKWRLPVIFKNRPQLGKLVGDE